MKRFLLITFSLFFATWALAEEKFDFQKRLKDAHNGNPIAQNEIGEYFAAGGNGEIARDYEIAVKWWEAASQQGNASAMTNLGAAYFSGNGVWRDPSKAVRYWSEAAKLGDAEAQYFIGTVYCNGLGVMRDYQTAVFWWDKAASKGHSRAQNNLAFAYARGEGVDRDIKKAFKFCGTRQPCRTSLSCPVLFYGRWRC